MRKVYCDENFKLYSHQKKLIKAVAKGEELKIIWMRKRPIPLSAVYEFYKIKEELENGKEDETEKTES